jgi:hypothetical protein
LRVSFVDHHRSPGHLDAQTWSTTGRAGRGPLPQRGFKRGLYGGRQSVAIPLGPGARIATRL